MSSAQRNLMLVSNANTLRNRERNQDGSADHGINHETLRHVHSLNRIPVERKEKSQWNAEKHRAYRHHFYPRELMLALNRSVPMRRSKN